LKKDGTPDLRTKEGKALQAKKDAEKIGKPVPENPKPENSTTG